MVTVVGPGELPSRRAMVSVGVVNDRLETLLYGRVAVPKGCEVIDGAFARIEGGLCASWDEGIPASYVSDFLGRHAAEGGALVGWEIHHDLDVMGFGKAACGVRSGARENLPLERAHPIDGGDSGIGSSPRAACPAAEDPRAPSSPNAETGGSDGDRFGGECVDLQRCTINENDSCGDELGDFSLERPPGDVTQSGVPRAGQGGEVAAEGAASATVTRSPRKGSGGMRVVEVTDLFRSMKGLKCMLGEAYACCFDRVEEGLHNAAVDARMVMELYNLWKRTGQPGQPFRLPLSFFVVNFHSFKPRSSRLATLWSVLRPDGVAGAGLRGRHGAIEKDSGSNTYKLSFRSEGDRESYLCSLERKMSSAGLKWEGDREFVPGKKGAGNGYQLSCGSFKMHVLEHER